MQKILHFLQLRPRLPSVWLWLALIPLTLFFLRLGVLPAWREMRSDFPNYYVSSRVLTAGEDPRLLYDDAWFQRRIEREGINQAGRFSTFPPCTAFAMLPLTPFSPDSARRLWLGINLALLLLAVIQLGRLCELDPSTTAVWVFLAGNALVSNFVLGQLYLAVTAITLMALVLAERGHELTAGALLGACISIKYFPVVFLPALWMRRRWRALLACATTMACITGLELLIFGWETWSHFAGSVFLPHLDGLIANQGDGHVIAYQSFNSLFRNLLVHHPRENPHPLWTAPGLYPFAKWITLALIGGVGAWCFLAQKGTELTGYRRRQALAGATAMVLLPVTATYHLLLFLPSLGLLLAELWRDHRRFAAALVASFWALLGFAPFWRLAALDRDGFMLLLHYPRLFLLLGIWLVAILGLWPRQSQAIDKSSSARGFSNSIAHWWPRRPEKG